MAAQIFRLGSNSRRDHVTWPGPRHSCQVGSPLRATLQALRQTKSFIQDSTGKYCNRPAPAHADNADLSKGEVKFVSFIILAPQFPIR
jgi:hypothetical protein